MYHFIDIAKALQETTCLDSEIAAIIVVLDGQTALPGDVLDSLAGVVIKKNVVYVSFVGPDAEKYHDRFDAKILDHYAARADVAMTAFEDCATIGDAVVHVARYDLSFANSLGYTLIVGSLYARELLESVLKAPD